MDNAFTPISYIYALTDPRDPWVTLYIGKANNPAARLKSHLRDARVRKSRVCAWVQSLVRDGVEPMMVVIRATPDWVSAERELIADARAHGLNLLNISPGGTEPPSPIDSKAWQTALRKRPKHVMRAYRRLELAVRKGSKSCAIALEKFSHLVDWHREHGTLAALDARLATTLVGR